MEVLDDVEFRRIYRNNQAQLREYQRKVFDTALRVQYQRGNANTPQTNTALCPLPAPQPTLATA